MAATSKVIRNLELEEKLPTHVYVTIPEKDMFDLTHPGVGINRDHYGPGTHFVPQDIADEITRICATFDAQNIRILQPRRDQKALQALLQNKGYASNVGV